MVSASDQRPELLDSEMVVPAWLVWLQLGLSTTLAVLFVVMLVRSLQQSATIRQLQDRVAGIENSRALDRTTAIEDQLRTTAERIQVLERQGAQTAALAGENARLRQQLSSAQRGAGKSAATPLGDGSGLSGDDAIAPLPPIKP
jgi:hypothetical protein